MLKKRATPLTKAYDEVGSSQRGVHFAQIANVLLDTECSGSRAYSSIFGHDLCRRAGLDRSWLVIGRPTWDRNVYDPKPGERVRRYG
jgi:hypothetical protein